MSSPGHSHRHELTRAQIHDHVGDELAAHDQRYTAGRRRLVDVIANAGRPLTLPALLSAAPDLAQSSAYRNLEVLERCGVVARISGTGDHSHYELAEPLAGHHHHLICASCGLVIDIELDEKLEHMVDEHLTQAAARVGFAPRRHVLDLFGDCSSCHDDSPESSNQTDGAQAAS